MSFISIPWSCCKLWAWAYRSKTFDTWMLTHPSAHVSLILHVFHLKMSTQYEDQSMHSRYLLSISAESTAYLEEFNLIVLNWTAQGLFMPLNLIFQQHSTARNTLGPDSSVLFCWDTSRISSVHKQDRKNISSRPMMMLKFSPRAIICYTHECYKLQSFLKPAH